MKSLRALRIFKNRQKRRGLFRVLAYFTFIWIVCTVVSLRHARAEYTDQALDIGRQLAVIGQATKQDQTTIVFNGQKIRISNATSAASPKEVLTHFEEYCTGHASAFLTDVSDGPKDKADGTRAGFVRLNGNDVQGDGAVICFVRGPESKPTRKEAFETFAETGNLGAIGELRYAYVNKSPSGRTHLMTAWTDSSFNLLRIAPRTLDEDVAGEDFPDIPRAPASTRFIAARAEGTPYAMNVYKTKQTGDQVMAFYDQEMQAKGWFKYDPEVEATDPGMKGRGFFKQGVVLTVNTRTEEGETYYGLGLAGVGHEDKVGKLKE